MSPNGLTNGVHHALVAGIYAPVPSFFHPDSEDLNLAPFETHVKMLANAGVAPVVAGSMGEAIHLSHAERTTLIQTARRALNEGGHTGMPVIAGTGAGSLRETVELGKAAKEAGADYALVITSGFFAGALMGNNKVLKEFFTAVADKTPIPVIIYNYPGACGGIDLDSDLITELAAHPNIAGVKLTCGNVGKLTRIADSLHFAPKPSSDFLILGGYADIIMAGALSNAGGAITGLANLAPYATTLLLKTSQLACLDRSVLPEAQRIQGIVARGDFTIAKTGIAGTKLLLEKVYGYGGLCRRPLPPMNPVAFEKLWEHAHVQELLELERELAKKAKVEKNHQ